MNDRIPGSCGHNPIFYKGCSICICDPETPGGEWEWWITDMPYIFVRMTASSEAECKRMIDDMQDMLKGFRKQ